MSLRPILMLSCPLLLGLTSETFSWIFSFKISKHSFSTRPSYTPSPLWPVCNATVRFSSPSYVCTLSWALCLQTFLFVFFLQCNGYITSRYKETGNLLATGRPSDVLSTKWNVWIGHIYRKSACGEVQNSWENFIIRWWTITVMIRSVIFAVVFVDFFFNN
jgi:hypothetical protein